MVRGRDGSWPRSGLAGRVLGQTARCAPPRSARRLPGRRPTPKAADRPAFKNVSGSGGNGTGPRAAKRPRRRRGAFGTRRPVPLARPTPLSPVASPGRRPTPKAADRPAFNRKRRVSPGLTRRRIGASDARRAKAKRISERARAWRARSERSANRPGLTPSDSPERSAHRP